MSGKPRTCRPRRTADRASRAVRRSSRCVIFLGKAAGTAGFRRSSPGTGPARRYSGQVTDTGSRASGGKVAAGEHFRVTGGREPRPDGDPRPLPGEAEQVGDGVAERDDGGGRARHQDDRARHAQH
jgi:hypothetical protein